MSLAKKELVLLKDKIQAERERLANSFLVDEEKFVIKSEEFEPALTNDLDKKLGLNLSSVSPCSDKSIDVLTTRCAFLENHNVSTIIIPSRRIKILYGCS